MKFLQLVMGAPLREYGERFLADTLGRSRATVTAARRPSCDEAWYALTRSVTGTRPVTWKKERKMKIKKARRLFRDLVADF